MNYQDFQKICAKQIPPEGLHELLLALWYDYQGDWDKAHSIAQGVSDNDGSWVHAYLHREEGDQANASYWYNRARKSKPYSSLKEEWKQIAIALLSKYQ